MTPPYHPRPERWPQVSLKGLLIGVTLVGILTPYARWEYGRCQARQRSRTLPRQWNFGGIPIDIDINKNKTSLLPTRLPDPPIFIDPGSRRRSQLQKISD